MRDVLLHLFKLPAKPLPLFSTGGFLPQELRMLFLLFQGLLGSCNLVVQVCRCRHIPIEIENGPHYLVLDAGWLGAKCTNQNDTVQKLRQQHTSASIKSALKAAQPQGIPKM